MPLQYFLLGLPLDHTAPGHPFGKLGLAFLDTDLGFFQQSETQRKLMLNISDCKTQKDIKSKSKV